MAVIREKPVKEVVARAPHFSPLASRATNVAESDPTRYLRIALRLVGVAFIVGIYTFVNVWPSGCPGMPDSRITCRITCR